MAVNKNKQIFLKRISRLKKRIGAFEVLIGFLILLGLGLVMLQFRSKENWVKAEVRVVITSGRVSYWGESPPYWLSETFKAGNKEYDSQGKLIAEVLKVKKLELGGESKDAYLILNLKVSKNRKTGKLEFKHRPLEIGAPVELHLSNSYVSGLVTFVEGIEDERVQKEIVINAIWMNVFPCQAEAITVGGKMKDETGEAVAEILDKKVELHTTVVTTDRGDLLVRKHPLKRDISLRIKLKVKEQGGLLYFHEHKKVKIGEVVSIYLPEIDFHPMIEEIFDFEGNKL